MPSNCSTLRLGAFIFISIIILTFRALPLLSCTHLVPTSTTRPHNSPMPSSSSYPAPFIQSPTSQHQNTLILLHGTSQDGPSFASALLNFPIPLTVIPSTGLANHNAAPSSQTQTQSRLKNHTLPQIFPGTRFVFPTGRKRWCAVLGRESHAWFDFASFSDRTLREETQVKGLSESAVYLGELFEVEAGILEDALGRGDAVTEGDADVRGRIMIGGFSQGTAMACIALLSGQLGLRSSPTPQYQAQIKGFVGLSGWCPFRIQILDSLSRSSHPTETHKLVAARRYVRELLGLEVDESTAEQHRLNQTPLKVFLGHGERDTKMKPEWGREMGDLLEEVGFEVRLKAYRDLEHSWNGEEIGDLVAFLRESWEVE